VAILRSLPVEGRQTPGGVICLHPCAPERDSFWARPSPPSAAPLPPRRPPALTPRPGPTPSPPRPLLQTSSRPTPPVPTRITMCPGTVGPRRPRAPARSPRAPRARSSPATCSRRARSFAAARCWSTPRASSAAWAATAARHGARARRPWCAPTASSRRASSTPTTTSPSRRTPRTPHRRALRAPPRLAARRRGHTRLSSAGSASNDQVAWGELRFVLGGATSVNGSGGVAGFLRNLDRAAHGRPRAAGGALRDLPLGDSGGALLTTGCGYPSIDTAIQIANVDAYTPHVAEGIGPEARNEFLCIRTGRHRPRAAAERLRARRRLLPPDIAEMATRRHVAHLVAALQRHPLRRHRARHRVRPPRGAIALGSDWIISGLDEHAPRAALRRLAQRQLLGRLLHRRGHLAHGHARRRGRPSPSTTPSACIAPGRVADLAIFNGAMRRDHRAVIDAAPGDVALVLRGGAALYGDAEGGGLCPAARCATRSTCAANEARLRLARPRRPQPRGAHQANSGATPSSSAASR
jgi:hypothetical protein